MAWGVSQIAPNTTTGVLLGDGVGECFGLVDGVGVAVRVGVGVGVGVAVRVGVGLPRIVGEVAVEDGGFVDVDVDVTVECLVEVGPPGAVLARPGVLVGPSVGVGVSVETGSDPPVPSTEGRCELVGEGSVSDSAGRGRVSMKAPPITTSDSIPTKAPISRPRPGRHGCNGASSPGMPRSAPAGPEPSGDCG
jgi:hypothetical protein